MDRLQVRVCPPTFAEYTVAPTTTLVPRFPDVLTDFHGIPLPSRTRFDFVEFDPARASV